MPDMVHHCSTYDGRISDKQAREGRYPVRGFDMDGHMLSVILKWPYADGRKSVAEWSWLRSPPKKAGNFSKTESLPADGVTIQGDRILPLKSQQLLPSDTKYGGSYHPIQIPLEIPSKMEVQWQGFQTGFCCAVTRNPYWVSRYHITPPFGPLCIHNVRPPGPVRRRSYFSGQPRGINPCIKVPRNLSPGTRLSRNVSTSRRGRSKPTDCQLSRCGVRVAALGHNAHDLPSKTFPICLCRARYNHQKAWVRNGTNHFQVCHGSSRRARMRTIKGATLRLVFSQS
ncbi:hypothetical protein BXZ70DRAFT_478008 [Cristinia sonorae]|uniref:Uncharacterized protein n=1 Tax=Cristinia sonorae TaxID=1940300 RepID=A0A8K0UH67_9AGAR|nr:hypothetical protein BXZ70DRAFT_478008 [Cristinia sonorae]